MITPLGEILAVHQLPALRPGALGEQALAAADGEGEGPHVHAVDQPVREQSLDEIAAAVHPQVGAVIVFQLFQLGRHIAADQEGVLPGQGHGGVGHDLPLIWQLEAADIVASPPFAPAKGFDCACC